MKLKLHFSTGPIEHALRWGTLPRTYSCPTDEERSLFLKSYTETYLQEEIVAEQAIRNLPPFRRLLQIASQTNATVVNFSKVADNIQTDPSNVKNYFQILEDTFVVFSWNRFISRCESVSAKNLNSIGSIVVSAER